MYPQSRSLTAWLFGALLTFAFTLGCGPAGPRLAPVKGTITYKGKPLEQGTVMFEPEQGQAATGEIRNGAYSLKTNTSDGAVLGKHKVTVISLPDQSNILPEDRNPLPAPVIPLTYSFADKSGLSATVEDKANTINFDLK